LRICRFHLPRAGPRLGAIVEDDVFDLTASGRAELATLEAFLAASDTLAAPPSAWLSAQLAGLPRLCSYHALQRPPGPDHPHLLKPLDNQEVWAAGVTYFRSRTAREEESHGSGIYERVYVAERPEIFFKATPSRTVGPFEPVRVRSDSRWSVPEAELALVLSPQLRLIGYTAANDVTARDIEGENPLYLPQAKIYAACCAVGPCITLADSFEAAKPAAITCAIRRAGVTIFHGETRTDRIRRPLAGLIAYLGRDNLFPAGALLLTGTGIVPPDDVSLQAGDSVEITIERIGTLLNPVERG
jgi:2-dehydro-3-deoxy-D-arabinonate dehydratase